jgi:CheY-like chemotaxis protein
LKKGEVVETIGDKPKKLLIVDDIGAVRKRYASILRSEGYEVMVAVDGKEALELAGRYFFDLILLDLNMPGMHGLDVLYELRSMYSKMREVFHVTDVPVLFISGYSSEEAVSTAHLLGAAGILNKPVNLEELLTTVKELLKDGYDPSSQRRRIVVVIDPSAHIRGLFRHIFEGMGWSVLEGRDPERLFAMLNGAPPYAIVVSLPSAQHDEEALLDRLSSMIGRIPMLVIAQSAMQQLRVEQRLNGRAVILLRPLEVGSLAKAVDEAQQLTETTGKKGAHGPSKGS